MVACQLPPKLSTPNPPPPPNISPNIGRHLLILPLVPKVPVLPVVPELLLLPLQSEEIFGWVKWSMDRGFSTPNDPNGRNLVSRAFSAKERLRGFFRVSFNYVYSQEIFWPNYFSIMVKFTSWLYIYIYFVEVLKLKLLCPILSETYRSEQIVHNHKTFPS